ncbi:MAG: tol-pal system-associated acyl-CoA thioesterase [Magnetococcus sp. YQC-5]
MSEPEFQWPVRVYYEDTDAGGVVYHASYLKFMERARTEWLRQLGWQQESLFRESGLLFAVARMEIDFLASAHLDDALNVTVTLKEQKRVSLTLEQTITCKTTLKPVLIWARVRIALLNRDFKPARFPVELRDRLQLLLDERL